MPSTLAPPDPAQVERAAAALRGATSALFITGAGLSADSGLPTYRGVGGLYDRDTTEEGYPIEVALSGQMLRHRPAVCWKYMAEIEAACRGAAPNRAHEVIAALEQRLRRVWVLTQNVDGLHRRAGSVNVIEIHGNLSRLDCLACGYREPREDLAGVDIPPLCPDCGGGLRPPVVLFGEMLPPAAIGALERELAVGFDVVFSVGTTSVFPYIAAPVHLARRQGCATVEINPGESEVSGAVDLRMRCGAAAGLGAIYQAL